METDSVAAAETRRWNLIAVLALPVLVALAFAAVVRFGFVYDDRWTVIDNPVLRAPGNLRWLLGRDLVRAGVPDAARPLLLATEMLDWALWRARPAGWHAQNLVWHTGVVLLLFAHLRRWGLAPVIALGTAALFAVHPLVVEPVSAINYREDLLAAFFVLLALWFAMPNGSPLRAAAAGFALLLGTLAKENALVTPLLFAITVSVAPSRAPVVAGATRVDLRGGALALLGAIGVALSWRWWALGGVAQVSLTAEIPADHRSLLLRVPRAALTFAQGIGQFVWPAYLAPEYPDLPATAAISWLGWLALAVIAGLAVVAWRARRRSWLLALGWLFALVAYLPNFGLVPLTNQRADRYFYLPAVGLAMAVAGLLTAIASRRRPSVGAAPGAAGIVGAVGLVVLGALLVRSRRQQRIWRDDVTLFSAAVASDPDSQRALIGLGTAQLRRGQTVAALEAAERALALGDAPRARELRGLIWLAQGDPGRARGDLQLALAGASDGHRAQVLNNLALAEIALHDLALARGHLLAAIEIAPRFDRPPLQLARLALEAGDLASARRDLGTLLARVPESIDGWRLLAAVEARAGQSEAARAAAQRARDLGGDENQPSK
jgi:MYXO-CTERM domain-containing protein